MMQRFYIFMLLFLLAFSPAMAEAGKKDAAPAPAPYIGANAEQQKAFTEKYFQAVDSGNLGFGQFVENISSKGTLDEVRMLDNLKKGKAADGGERKGFRGDPNDPGPQDWSDYTVETDKDGNVTGIVDKDHYQKDANGDGKVTDKEAQDYEAKRADEFMDKDGDGTVSDQEKKDAAKEMDTNKDGKVDEEEREEWNDNKAEEKEIKDNGGNPPGETEPIPDWDDSPHDGKPDADFVRDCWQCKKPVQEPPPTHVAIGEDGGPGWCELKGLSSQANCGGKCPPILCVPLDIDIKSGKIVPTMQTRERGSTRVCYGCIKPKRIKITWVIIIVETPYARYVLGKNAAGSHFKPSSVMALAAVDEASGMIQNTVGQLMQAKNFLGSFNVGMGLPGLPSMGQVSMEQMTSLLTSGLNSAGGYTADCFGNVVDAANEGAPPENAADEKPAKKGKKKQKEEAMSEAELKSADKNGNPAVSGPIVACGEEDGNKVLKIYSAGGALVDTITQAALKLNPNIILEKMGIAQEWSDMFIQKSGIDFAGYIEKFTGLPVKQIQSTAAQVAQIKAQADQLLDKKKKKKAKEEEAAPIVPNDPLYDEGLAKQKKKMFGILGSSKAPPPNPMGSLIKTGLEAIEANKAEEIDLKDQWGLQKIGFTPWGDPNSAWNVVDANEKNIVVAVVDSGLDMTHPDGPQYIWKNPKEVTGNGIDDDEDGFIDDINGWNFVDDNHDFTDIRGHGTFVTGIIAAKYNNGIGIAGINPGAVIMPIKVADEEGETNSLLIYRGINYAVDHGAKVINVSLGSRSISKLEQQAVERAHSFGALVVIASGNGNDNIVTFGPSSSKHALSVGQIDYVGTRSTVSNWGPNLGLVAPGEQIYSLCSKDNKHVLPSIRKEGYYKQNGTSFSTPMVAATASLIWAKNPNLTNRQVADIILATATDMGDAGWDGMTGAGLLNASAALRSETTDQLTIMFTNLRVNRDNRDKVVSVDVYGTVRGQFKEYTLEAGKGKNASRFATVAGPFGEEADYQHIARLNVQDVLRGADDWILRLKVLDNNGKEHVASTPFTLPK